MEPTTPTRIVVVGGGLAGLVAAVSAADRGAAVTLVETRAALGGRARTDELDGHLVNLGPHAVYEGGPGLAALRELGVDPAGGRPPTAGALGVEGQRIAKLPVGPWTLLRSPFVRGRSRWAMANAFRRLGATDPATLDGRSAADWLDELAGDPAATRVLQGYTRVATYCADLDEVSARVACAQDQMGLAGVRYLHGGWQSMVDALADRARSAGVVIRTGVTVRGLIGSDGRWAIDGLDGLDGGPVDAVVLAGLSPDAAARLSGSAELAVAARDARPIEAASLDLGLSTLPRPDRLFAYGLDEPWYYSVHNPPARLGTGHTLHVMRYLHPDDDRPADEIRRELETVIDRLQPGRREVTTVERFLARMTVAHDRLRPHQHPSDRPTATVGDRPGLFVAGDWVGPDGHLADASIASAVEAGRRAAAHAGVSV